MSPKHILEMLKLAIHVETLGAERDSNKGPSMTLILYNWKTFCEKFEALDKYK